MKKILLVLGIVFCLNHLIAGNHPFNKGINLTDWFQKHRVGEINFTKFKEKDFLNIKSLGCDVIRLPVNFHSMTDGSPDYNIDPLLFYFLDQAIDWAEKLKINLIIDNHSFDPAVPTIPQVEQVLIKVWSQIAKRYKNRSNLIYYEILNEPHGIDSELWANIQLNVVKKIREIDKKHTIIVGGAHFNSLNQLKSLSYYDIENLIYTFHFYDPFLFTHQGAFWVGSPYYSNFKNIPFPYDKKRMPTYNIPKKDFAFYDFRNYKNEGTIENIKRKIDIAYNFSKDRNVPVYCGEFGVYMLNSPEKDRNYWYEVVRKYFEEKAIFWTIWEYKGGFGIFNKNSNELFEYDLNIPLLKSLGFNIPKQNKFYLMPEKNGFTIYDDFVGDYIDTFFWFEKGSLHLYYKEDFNSQNHCIHLSNLKRYETLVFEFKPERDFTNLVKDDYSLEFLVKADKDISFVIRFVNSEKNVNFPWRMGITIDNKKVQFNGKWQKVKILLKDFEEMGAWSNNRWFSPRNLFNWKYISKLEVVSEEKDLENIDLFLDDIKITK